MSEKYYTYIYLDPRKKGPFKYGDYVFEYEPFYVGKGKCNRMEEHLCDYLLKKSTHKNNKLKKIINEGYEPIIIKISDNLFESDAFDSEVKLIKLIGRHDLGDGPLTNKTDGGEGSSGVIISDKTKSKISKTLLSKNIVRSEETKRKISEANTGRVYSDEYIQIMKEIRKGPKLSHRNKYVVISPKGEEFNIVGRVELNEFTKKHSLSIRKLLEFLDKGVITSNNVRVVINGENNKTKNCIGWTITKIK